MHSTRVALALFLVYVPASQNGFAQSVNLEYRFTRGSHFSFHSEAEHGLASKKPGDRTRETSDFNVHVDTVYEDGSAEITVTAINEKHANDKVTAKKGKVTVSFSRAYAPPKYRVRLALNGSMISGEMLERNEDYAIRETLLSASDSLKQWKQDQRNIAILIGDVFRPLPKRSKLLLGQSWTDTVRSNFFGEGSPEQPSDYLFEASPSPTSPAAPGLVVDSLRETRSLTVSTWVADSATHPSGVRCLKITRDFIKNETVLRPAMEMESTSKDVRRECIWLRGSDGALLEYEHDSRYENEYTGPELNSEGLPERITVKQPPSLGRYRLRQVNID